MDGMTDYDELRKLTAAATPGPWVAWDDPGEWMDPPVVAVDDGHPRGAGHIEIAEMGQGEAQGSHNARLIAAMRNALPVLLAENARLRDHVEIGTRCLADIVSNGHRRTGPACAGFALTALTRMGEGPALKLDGADGPQT